MNSLKEIFVGPKGIRSAWRFLIFLSITMAAVQGLYWTLTHVIGYREIPGWNPINFIIEGSLYFASALLAAAIMARIERRTFRDYGLPPNQAFRSLFWMGMLWGSATSALEILLIYAAGGLSFDGFALHGMALFSSALWWLVAMILLGLWEEFMFRGYPLTTLATAIGFWPASIVMCFLFGASHLSKPMENWMDITSIMLYGLLWCFSFWRTGSIWFAIGFHAMSDYSDMVIFAAPNTGNNGQPLEGHLLNVVYHGPTWLTGGPRGIESSAMVFVILGLSFLVLNYPYPKKAWRLGGNNDLIPS